jgi:hypothetical protein
MGNLKGKIMSLTIKMITLLKNLLNTQQSVATPPKAAPAKAAPPKIRKKSNKLTKKQIRIIESLEGHQLPINIATGADNAVGHYVENWLENQGIPIDKFAVCDLADGKEIKTRKKSSSAKHTVGIMTYDKINLCSYDTSDVKKKLTYQIRLEWNEQFFTIDKVQFMDFRDKEIQKLLKKRYDASKAAVIAAQKNGFIRHNSYGDFEYKDGNCFAFRLPDAIMKQIISMSKSSGSRKNIFDIK